MTATPLVLQLFEAAQAVEEGAHESALIKLDRLIAAAPQDGEAVDRLARAFAVALKARLSGDATGIGNLYVDTRDPRDMLAAFEVLVSATPFIRFGHSAANHAIAAVMAGATHVHIVDIGLGSGVQWLHLLELVAGPDAPAIHLTGIDVPAPGDQPAARIAQAGEAIARRAAALGIGFTFEPIAGFVEDLDLQGLTGRADELLIVNAALALHHIPCDGGRRDDVLKRLRELQPAALCLVEPDVEHNALPFGQRVTESIVHYLTVFDALQAALPTHPAERSTLESAFFGREILNIVVGEGAARVERHERHDAWQARLRRLDYSGIDLATLIAPVREELALAAPFEVTVDDGVLLLSWRSLPVLAVSAWTPTPAATA